MSTRFQFVPAIVLSLLVTVVVGLDTWLLLSDGAGRELIVIVLVTELLVILAAIWIFTALLDSQIFRPLGKLQDHLRVLLCTDSNHCLDIGKNHRLGELPGYLEDLGFQIARERRETARAMKTVTEQIDHRKTRLEVILRDLHEGVIVCNDEHRIVLFNQSAASLLKPAGPVGLHRPIESVLTGRRTLEEYARLKLRHAHYAETSLLARYLDDTLDRRRIQIRMSPIIEPTGAWSGYVLTFPGDESTVYDLRNGTQVSVLSDRPEFYDFSLFESRYDVPDPDKQLDGLDYVVFDTETTGLNPSKGDGIVQISGIRLVKGKTSGEEFDTLVNPGTPIPPSSTRFHGITDDMVLGAPSASEAVQAFGDFVMGSVLVAHNAAFDMKFLKLHASGREPAFENPVLDTLLISLILQPNYDSHTLDAIATRFGVELTAEARHTALGDARATAEVFIKMIPILCRSGIKTIGQMLEASERVFHSRKQQLRP